MHSSSANDPTYKLLIIQCRILLEFRSFTLRAALQNMSIQALRDSHSSCLMLSRDNEETSCRQLVLEYVAKDAVNVSKQSTEKGSRLANQSRVGPRRVQENALHKTTSLVQQKVIWYVYTYAYSSRSVVALQQIVGAFHFLGKGVLEIALTKGCQRLLLVAKELLVTHWFLALNCTHFLLQLHGRISLEQGSRPYVRSILDFLFLSELVSLKPSLKPHILFLCASISLALRFLQSVKCGCIFIWASNLTPILVDGLTPLISTTLLLVVTIFKSSNFFTTIASQNIRRLRDGCQLFLRGRFIYCKVS